ncbi:Pentatricopeptide repeat-containing protein [Apostasia shenzhenica]|uniref:Pentatricopeptide repeat-containing protein n=1 Tax=Apostasia shenzhenica TaxID=1088818 RepID=A0A2H9ZTB0_9ASPA|nr:Pentatricopeptide repeat-containing protein [Apostasia shenzhenica]
MELLSVSSTAAAAHTFFPSGERRCAVFVVSANRTSDSGALQKKSKRELSTILRTEAAVLGVERKAVSAKSDRLWPRAVLEALDNSIANNRWESALKVIVLLLLSVISEGFLIKKVSVLALKIFELLRKQLWYRPKGQTFARLLTMLGKCNQPEHAASLFNTMHSEGFKPTLDVYTSLLGAFGRSGLLKEAFYTIHEMKTISDCRPDAYTYTILIGCCSKLKRFDLIPSLLTEMSYLGIHSTVVTYNTIIDGYGKAGLFEKMENSVSDLLESGDCLPDIFTLNSMISAYGDSGKITAMEKWYIEFQHMGIDPDLTTFNILIRTYGKAGMYDKMMSVFRFMKKRYFSPNTITFNTVIECFAKAGDIEKMEYYFRLMKIRGIKPNCITYCSLVSGYSRACLLEKVPLIIRQTENTDVVLDTPFFNSVIYAYGQAGEIELMKETFSLMKEKKCKPDYITVATMNKAYSDLGMERDAQELELKMVEQKKSSYGNFYISLTKYKRRLFPIILESRENYWSLVVIFCGKTVRLTSIKENLQ